VKACELDSSGSDQGLVAGCCEHSNELLVPRNPDNVLTARFSGRLLLVQFAVTSDSRSGDLECRCQHTAHLPTVGKAVCCPPGRLRYTSCRKTAEASSIITESDVTASDKILISGVGGRGWGGEAETEGRQNDRKN